MKKLITLLLFTKLFMSCNTDKPIILPLQKDWRIQSSAKIDADAETISSPGFDEDGWYKMEISKTALAAMTEDDDPSPYFVSNLKSIPGYREGRRLIKTFSFTFHISETL